MRAEKTHAANLRATKHLKTAFGTSRLLDITADHVELYLQGRLRQQIKIKTSNGFRQGSVPRPATVHQELRVLRRMLNVAVRKKLVPANPCAGAEFPVRVEGLFRPHYVTWSEQQRIESHAPRYLRNVIPILAETGLRAYKELMPVKKDQVDLQNGLIWIPDSKTPNGIAEVPLTSIAREAFRDQMLVAGEGPFLFPCDLNSTGPQKSLRRLRPPIHLRDPAEFRRRGR